MGRNGIDCSMPGTSDTKTSQNSGSQDWVKIKTDQEGIGCLPRGWPVARITWAEACRSKWPTLDSSATRGARGEERIVLAAVGRRALQAVSADWDTEVGMTLSVKIGIRTFHRGLLGLCGMVRTICIQGLTASQQL